MNKIILQSLEKPKTATIAIPGSKSYTNRALLLAALTQGPVTIENPLLSDDTQAMISCLKTLGISIDEQSDRFIVYGSIADVKDQHYELNADLSGTTIRFITALACLVPGTKTIFGKEGLNKRPIGELVEGLVQLGAEISYLDKEGYPPISIKSSQLSPGETILKGDISSQFFSAILMIAPLVGQVVVKVDGEQISKSYIDMTIDTMAHFGVQVENQQYQRYKVKGQTYHSDHYIVEGDYSGAGYFLAIAALTGSTLTLTNLNPQSKQGDKAFLDILVTMGNQVSFEKNAVTLHGKGIKPVDVDMNQCPDQAQTLAVLAAFADGTTHMTGIKSLRVKETERVKALETELAKMGIKTESTEDSLTIFGGNPQPAIIDTYGDHRMAMAFAVAGTKLDGMVINNPEVVSKTLPNFWELLKQIN